MKKINLGCLLASVAILILGLVGCKKDDPVEPKPVEDNKIYVVSDNFVMDAMLYKTDIKSKCTYIESWTKVGEDSYVPFMQYVDANGKAKWSNWVQMTKREAISWVSTTVFDITTEGNVINIYSAKGDSGDIMHPYITMIRPDGSFAWGENGKLFYDFGDKANNTPCEGYVAADNNGGAWVAACCAGPMMAVARINSEGDMVTDPILFDPANGSSGAKSHIRNPQMFVNSSNELLMIVQYANSVGGGSTEAKLDGYVDVIKISADGTIQSQELLMSNRIYSLGFRPKIVEDGLGGAYVVCLIGESTILKAYAYHFDANGKTNGFGEVDIVPTGCTTGSLNVLATLDKSSHKLVCVWSDINGSGAYTALQTIDQTGHKDFEGDGKQLVMVPEGSIISNMAKLVTTDDSRILMTFVNSPLTGSNINLYKAWIDIEKGEAQVEKDIKIDVPILYDGDSDSKDVIIDGVLRHFWTAPSSNTIYGYDLKVK